MKEYAAFHLLSLASETDGANPVRDQIRIMWEEHRPFNSKSLNGGFFVG